MGKKSAPKLSPSQRKKWLTALQPAVVKADDGLQNKNVRYRVVVDTNILISALLYGGNPEQVLRHVLAQHYLITSDYIINELIGYLKKVRPKAPQKWIRLLRQKLEKYCCEDSVDIKEEVRDINDAAILKLAIVNEAIIVTNDKDLLEHKSLSKVAIISIAEYKELFNLTEVID